MEQDKNGIDTGNHCCGVCFKFDIVNVNEISNLTFYSAGGNVVIVTYVKDGKLYLSVSFDCGTHWQKPVLVMDVGGTVNHTQILAKENQFVIVLMINDSITKQNVKKAVSGEINRANASIKWKECVKNSGKGKIINISAGFHPSRNPNNGKIDGESSVDFTFYFNDNGDVCLECNDHRCLVT
jgi:hypothetical protein